MAPKTKKRNEVVPTTKNEVAVYDYGEDAGQGIADAGRDELAIPFLTILQGLSPQVKPTKKGGIEGAEIGMLFNTVTQELTDGDEGIPFVPARREHVFVEWVPRAKGGGFVAMHTPDSEVVVAAKEASTTFGKYSTPAGNDLVETFYLYGMILNKDGEPIEVALLAFKSMFIKKYKALISRLRYLMVPGPGGKKINPPIWANSLRVKTVPDKNAKGEFYNFEVSFLKGKGTDSLLTADSPAYVASKDLAEAISLGSAKADHSSTTNDDEDEGTPAF